MRLAKLKLQRTGQILVKIFRESFTRALHPILTMNSRTHIAVLILIAFCSFAVIAQSDENPRTVLEDGTEMIGHFERIDNDLLPAHGKVESYYGIPYSEPPVGTLRFKPPVAKGKLDSPFHATEVGKSCMQGSPEAAGLPFTNEELSEDCLFLDVIVPHPKPTKASVYVFIHGGGFSAGSGNMPDYANWSLPAFHGDIIVVTMNYRLNTFGFLSTGDELIPGNLGLLDQQLALKWVNKNIGAFGGDPESVTVGGVSAGSAGAGLLALSPGSRGLFKRVLMQSGGPLDMMNIDRSKEFMRTDVETLAKLLECSEEEIADDARLLGCLQRASAEDIIEQASKIGEFLGDPGRMPPTPTIDGNFLPESPLALVEAGKVNGESIMIGTNGDEGTVFVSFTNPDKEVKPVIDSVGFAPTISLMGMDPLDDGLVDLVKALYAPDTAALLDKDREDFFEEAVAYFGDRIFMCSHSQFARLAAEAVDVYRYTMTYVPSVNCMGLKWAGAGHGDEGQFFMGRVFEDFLANQTRAEEKEMARKAMSYWVNFVKTGNPNGPASGGGAVEVELPEWPKFTKGNQLFKDLTPEMGDTYFRQRECFFHEKILPGLRESFAELRKLQGQGHGGDEKAKWTGEGQCADGSCHGQNTVDP